MTKKVVNEYLFDDIVCVIALSGYANNPRFGEEFDPDNEEYVKECIKRYIKPRLNHLNKDEKEKIRNTLEYYSRVNRDMSGYWYAFQDYPIQYPTEICLFAKWVGEELFGRDFSPCRDISQYVEIPDEYESLLRVRITD